MDRFGQRRRTIQIMNSREFLKRVYTMFWQLPTAKKPSPSPISAPALMPNPTNRRMTVMFPGRVFRKSCKSREPVESARRRNALLLRYKHDLQPRRRIFVAARDNCWYEEELRETPFINRERFDETGQ